jgi:hypothetical protein
MIRNSQAWRRIILLIPVSFFTNGCEERDQPRAGLIWPGDPIPRAPTRPGWQEHPREGNVLESTGWALTPERAGEVGSAVRDPAEEPESRADSDRTSTSNSPPRTRVTSRPKAPHRRSTATNKSGGGSAPPFAAPQPAAVGHARTMLTRGQALLAAGDIASARGFLESARTWAW